MNPSKQPKPSKTQEPEYVLLQVGYVCDAAPALDCCEFYSLLPSATSGKWRMCSDASAENRKPAQDGAGCVFYMFAQEGGANGVSDADVDAAKTSINGADLCGAGCSLQEKDGLSYSKILSGDASSIAVSAVLLVATVLALAL